MLSGKRLRPSGMCSYSPIPTTMAMACSWVWLRLSDQRWMPSCEASWSRHAVQAQQRLPGWAAQDFDLLPGHQSDAGSEGFGNGFFGSEASRQGGRLLPHFIQLLWGKNAGQEALAVTLNGGADALNFDHIDTSDQFHFKSTMQSSSRTSQGNG